MAEIQHEVSDDNFVQSLSEPEEDGVNSIVAESKGKETPEKSCNFLRVAPMEYESAEEEKPVVIQAKSRKQKRPTTFSVLLKSLRLLQLKEALVKVTEGKEYESAEEEKPVVIEAKEQESEPSNLEESEAIAETEEVEGEFLPQDPNDEVSEDEEELEEGEYVEEERQQGDGEECSPADAATEKELDFDEDIRNPQYIPRKGIFYEHDDRNNEKEEKPIRDRKKKLWLDEGKWRHDRFREEEQNPKSQHELIESYGYDIRNEDGPPRKRQRYGRGPTKYDRNWKDGTAYNREKFQSSPRGAARSRRGIGGGREGPRFRGSGRSDFDNREYSRSPVALHSNIKEVPDVKEAIKESQ